MPNCGKRADILTDLTTYHTKLTCPDCLHQIVSFNKRTDLLLNAECFTCDSRIYIKRYHVQNKKQAIKITCTACGAKHSYQPTYKEYTGTFPGKAGYDPFLNLELWLQAPYKNYLFWAFNYGHLTYLENYIAARLRERNNRKHMTMVEKLPLFIKSAKNREGLLKVITDLKRK